MYGTIGLTNLAYTNSDSILKSRFRFNSILQNWLTM